jgi:predicted ATPase/class 3 adenylate cyclase
VAPPAGTVALLFTDIEGSTALARALGPAWGDVLAAHHEIVGTAIEAHDGHVDGTEGDAFFAVFADPRAAAVAAVEVQRALRARAWPTPDGVLRVRMGLHAGHVERRAAGYVGLEVHRAARVAAAAHGGQLLLTDAARALAGDAVPTEDLGLHRLKDFPEPERLHCAVVDGEGAAAFPPPRTLELRPTNLPADDRLLVGRDAELQAVVVGLRQDGERLLTVTGFGGIGKSRLALAAGAALLDTHPGGVWWVPLATVTSAEAIPAQLGAALGVQDDGSRPLLEVLAARLGTSPSLAVLDNLEHLPGAAPVVAGLLAALPHLRVLATSQRPLRLGAEQVLPLAPLRPEDARELFVRLAARRRPDVELGGDRLAAVAALCEQLDNLPLAVELAVGRLGVLTPEQLRDRLATSPGVLRGEVPDAPDRHRSLQAALDWTLSLLSDGARALFARLGVFAGAVALEDVEAVCGDVLDELEELADVGIVRRDGERFRLPEALRQAAAAALGADPDGDRWRRAHAEHLAAVFWAVTGAKLSTVADYRRAQGLDADAVRALEWSWAADVALACRLAAARAVLLSDAGRVRESTAAAERVLECDSAPADARAAALAALGHNATVANRIPESVAKFRAAAELVDAATPLGFYARFGLIYAELIGDEPGRRERADAWVAAARASAPDHVLGALLIQRAQALLSDGDPAAASADLDEGAALAASSDAVCAWFIDTVRADIDLVSGRPVAAAEGYLRSVQAAAARGDALQVSFDLHGIATAVAAAGRHEDALELSGSATAHDAHFGRGGDALTGDPIFLPPIVAAREALGPERAAAAEARGRAVPQPQRLEHAYALAVRG